MTECKMTAEKAKMLVMVDCLYRKACEEGDHTALCVACLLTMHNLQTRSMKYAKERLQEMVAKWQDHEEDLDPLEKMLLTLAY